MNHPPEWSTGICGCCCGVNANPGICCLTTFCGGVGQGVLLKDLGIVDSCVCPVVYYTLLEIVTSRTFLLLPLANLRINMAKKLGVDEGYCTSCCMAFCCYPCSVAQLHRDAVDNNYRFETKTDTFGELFNAMNGDVKGDKVDNETPHRAGAPFFARRRMDLIPYRLVAPAIVNQQQQGMHVI
jgi:Cys-rich protein (TIGR01571 family)